MLNLLGELTAFATVVAISPFSVIPAIALVMHSERPRSTGFAFIAGWLAGKAAITVVFVQVPRLLEQIDRTPPAWVSVWARIIIGALLLGTAVWQWRKPTQGGERIESPRWLTRIKKITPAWAATVGVALTLVNPKVVLMCAAAGYAIGTASLNVATTTFAVAYFTLVAGSTAALPVFAYAVASHRIDPQLERLGAWLQRHGGTLLVVILVVVGLALLFSGIRAL